MVNAMKRLVDEDCDTKTRVMYDLFSGIIKLNSDDHGEVRLKSYSATADMIRLLGLKYCQDINIYYTKNFQENYVKVLKMIPQIIEKDHRVDHWGESIFSALG